MRDEPFHDDDDDECEHPVTWIIAGAFVCPDCGEHLATCNWCNQLAPVDGSGFMRMHDDRAGRICFGTCSVGRVRPIEEPPR